MERGQKASIQYETGSSFADWAPSDDANDSFFDIHASASAKYDLVDPWPADLRSDDEPTKWHQHFSIATSRHKNKRECGGDSWLDERDLDTASKIKWPRSISRFPQKHILKAAKDWSLRSGFSRACRNSTNPGALTLFAWANHEEECAVILEAGVAWSGVSGRADPAPSRPGKVTKKTRVNWAKDGSDPQRSQRKKES